jgi:hypothetical protein
MADRMAGRRMRRGDFADRPRCVPEVPAHGPAPRCCPAPRRSIAPSRPFCPTSTIGRAGCRRRAAARARTGVPASGSSAQRRVGRGTLVVVGMDAPARSAKNSFEKSHGIYRSRRVRRFCSRGQARAPTGSTGLGQTQCCTVTGIGAIVTASVGQRSTQAPQPVQASRITL